MCSGQRLNLRSSGACSLPDACKGLFSDSPTRAKLFERPSHALPYCAKGAEVADFAQLTAAQRIFQGRLGNARKVCQGGELCITPGIEPDLRGFRSPPIDVRKESWW